MAHQQQKVSPKFQCKIYFKHGSIFLLHMKKTHKTVTDFSIQCLDTVGWASGVHLACKKLGVRLLVVTI